MKRKIIFSTLLLVMVLTFCITLTGCISEDSIPIPDVQVDVFIYDEDPIIDDDIEKQLNQMLVSLEEKTEVEFVVITVESLQYHTIESYSNYVFNTLGIGKKDKDNGILLLVSRSDNKVRLEIGSGLEGLLNASKCGRILDEFFVPYRENDEYTQATTLTVQAIINIICEEYDIVVDGLDTKSVQLEEVEEVSAGMKLLILLGIIVGLIFLELITGYAFGDGFGDGIISAILVSSSGGRSSGGGGFGGGFSGGGGASR